MQILEWTIIITAGLILGSFATAIIFREPKGDPWWGIRNSYKRSKCPECKTVLSAINLVPFFSWLLMRGKCRYCQKPISYIYPLVELICLLSAITIYLIWGFSDQTFFLLCMLPFLMALLVIDLQYMILPNRLVLIVGAIGVFRLGIEMLVWQSYPLQYGVVNYILGAVLYGAIAWGLRVGGEKLLKKEALGLGDVKFFVVAGVWLGLLSFPDFCFVAGLLGLVLGIVWKIVKKQEVFPFGPALIISLCVLLLLNGSLFY